MITSQFESLRLEGDVLLKDWKGSELLHPNLLRLAEIATVDADLVAKSIGRLVASDLAAARDAFRRVFSAWMR